MRIIISLLSFTDAASIRRFESWKKAGQKQRLTHWRSGRDLEKAKRRSKKRSKREKIKEGRSKREDQRGRKCLKSLKRKEEIRMPVMQRVFPSEYSDEEIERFG